MNSSHTQAGEVGIARLIDAAEVILRATAHGNSDQSISLWTGSDTTAPADAHTLDELIEGVQFLQRLGLLDHPAMAESAATPRLTL